MYGLALEGGGALGAAHVGVLRALTEQHLIPQALSGTSAGSMAAATYAWRGEMADLEGLFQDVQAMGPKLLDLNLIGLLRLVCSCCMRGEPSFMGIFRGKRLERLMREHTQGATLAEAKLPLVLTSVDLRRGDQYLFSAQTPVQATAARWTSEATLAEAVHASCAIPIAFCPVEREDVTLVDGGVLENLPVTALRHLGVQHVLAVRLTVASQHTTPPDNILAIAKRTIDAVSIQQERLQTHAAEYLLDVLLPEGSGVFSFERMADFTTIGYNTAMAAMPMLRRLFGQAGASGGQARAAVQRTQAR